jgi:FkbM family methyltransferase
MAGSRNWVGKLFLRTPGSFRSIRNVPVIGDFVHRISHRMLPGDERVWGQIQKGPAKGLWLELNPRTGQSYLRGEAERAVQEVLAKTLRPGMVFYDLGANVGLFSLLGARLVGTNGKVFGFEPDAEVAGRLRSNVNRNGFSNVTVVEAGIWSSSGEIAFVAADASSPDRGTGALTADSNSTKGKRVRCVSLDDFGQNAALPDAIKCDIEGAEVEMFRGATRILETVRPRILLELHSESNNRSCCEILNEFAYRIELIDSNHILAVPQGSSE